MVDMEGGRNGERPPEEQLQPPQPHKCPRCDSFNTKFCYYNNYSLSQPRYFCKACRRYWTQGGTLRNVPIGGGCRKSKRARTTSSNSFPPAVRAQSFEQRLVASPMSNSLFLSSLAAMHSLPGNLCGGGGQIGGNISLPSDLKSSITFQPPSTLYPPPPGSFNFWTQALINTGGAASSSSASASSFWSCNDQTGSLLAPKTHPGFNPSQ